MADANVMAPCALWGSQGLLGPVGMPTAGFVNGRHMQSGQVPSLSQLRGVLNFGAAIRALIGEKQKLGRRECSREAYLDY